MSIRVCVIGAGAGGLNALRHLTAKPDIFQAVAYEQTSVIGGTWVYTDKTGVDDNGLPIHSSMYRYMRTNLPKEVMAFPDFPFPDDGPSFIGHEKVLQYLKDYTDNYGLHKFIQFNKEVVSVSPIKKDNPLQTKWNVKVRDVGQENNPSEQSEFDAVVVCNGHYSIPMVPDIPGLDTFTGQWIHSHNYRYPEHFSGQTVLCLGAGPSGTDIALDLAPHAKKVYMSNRNKLHKSSLPRNVHQVPGLSCIKTGSKLLLENGSTIETDRIILCTGYKYSFPFLSPECHPHLYDDRLTPLYKHIIHVHFKTIFFIGILKINIPFKQMDGQMCFIINYINGKCKSISDNDMLIDIENDYQKRLNMGWPHRYAHKMDFLQWAYNQDLAKLGGFDPIPHAIQKLYDYNMDYRYKHLGTYKNINYKLTNNSFERVYIAYKL